MMNTHRKVMNSSSPYQMKQLGKRIQNFHHEKWKKSAKKIARDGAMAKFSQNPRLAKKLKDTGNRTLAEASKETPWGIGIQLHDNGVLDQQNWESPGIMSEVLMAVREAIK